MLRPRVFGAAIIRELNTRVGRKKIGCLAPLSELADYAFVSQLGTGLT